MLGYLCILLALLTLFLPDPWYILAAVSGSALAGYLLGRMEREST